MPELKEEILAEPKLITDAKAQADRLEQQNKIMQENIAKLQEMEARNILGGKAEAGSAVKEMTKEDKINIETMAYAKRAGLVIRKYT